MMGIFTHKAKNIAVSLQILDKQISGKFVWPTPDGVIISFLYTQGIGAAYQKSEIMVIFTYNSKMMLYLYNY